MSLQTMEPAPTWTPGADERAAIETFEAVAADLTITVWGGDWCGDCQRELPPFAAALNAANIDPATVEQYPVEKEPDGSKIGPMVAEYDIESIPTIVIERTGVEIARFVESAPRPAIVELATELQPE